MHSLQPVYMASDGWCAMRRTLSRNSAACSAVACGSGWSGALPLPSVPYLKQSNQSQRKQLHTGYPKGATDQHDMASGFAG